MDTNDPNMDFVMEWQNYRIRVAYQPNWLSTVSGLRVAHFDITTVEPSRVAMPISETGYRSHFLHPDEVTANGGPEAFVKVWLAAQAKCSGWKAVHAATQQLDFFGGG